MIDPTQEYRFTEARSELRRKVSEWYLDKIDFSRVTDVDSFPDHGDWHDHAMYPGAKVKTRLRTADGCVASVDVEWSVAGWVYEHRHPNHAEEITVTRGHMHVFVLIDNIIERVELSPRSTPYCIPANAPHVSFSFRGTRCNVLFHPPITAQ